jgi:hypothetical protein
MRAERGFGVRRGIGRDDPDQERSLNRPSAVQRLSLPKATSMLLAIRDGRFSPAATFWLRPRSVAGGGPRHETRSS